MAVFLINGHLPEAAREVDCHKDGGVGPADVADALVDFLLGVFVRVDLAILSLEILDNL